MKYDHLYGWAIEYEVFHRPMVVFIRRKDEYDIAYTEQRAAELHGIIVPLIPASKEPSYAIFEQQAT